MSDIIDEIDRLHAVATVKLHGITDAERRQRLACRDSLKDVLLSSWPTFRDRLLRAERCLALADKALELKEQLNETLRRCSDDCKRKAKAFDLIANRAVHPHTRSPEGDPMGREWCVGVNGRRAPSHGGDLLTAIEAATKEAGHG